MTFQFTRPGRGATTWLRTRGCSLVFQFTHPGKGATSFAGESPPYPQSFNSRTLGRVRPDVLKAVVPATKVSIHAPWEGCDMVRSSTTTLSMSFNSRTLGRVRQTPCNHLCKRPLFQFTHPGKGATISTRTTMPLSWKFQFTHPGKGATIRKTNHFLTWMFQFTHPGKGATGRPSPSSLRLTSFNSRTLGRVRRTSPKRSPRTRLSFNSRTLGRVRLGVPAHLR